MGPPMGRPTAPIGVAQFIRSQRWSKDHSPGYRGVPHFADVTWMATGWPAICIRRLIGPARDRLTRPRVGRPGRSGVGPFLYGGRGLMGFFNTLQRVMTNDMFGVEAPQQDSRRRLVDAWDVGEAGSG